MSLYDYTIAPVINGVKAIGNGIATVGSAVGTAVNWTYNKFVDGATFVYDNTLGHFFPRVITTIVDADADGGDVNQRPDEAEIVKTRTTYETYRQTTITRTESSNDEPEIEYHDGRVAENVTIVNNVDGGSPSETNRAEGNNPFLETEISRAEKRLLSPDLSDQDRLALEKYINDSHNGRAMTGGAITHEDEVRPYNPPKNVIKTAGLLDKEDGNTEGKTIRDNENQDSFKGGFVLPSEKKDPQNSGNNYAFQGGLVETHSSVMPGYTRGGSSEHIFVPGNVHVYENNTRPVFETIENHGDPIDLSAREQGGDLTKGTVEYIHDDAGFVLPSEKKDPQNSNNNDAFQGGLIETHSSVTPGNTKSSSEHIFVPGNVHVYENNTRPVFETIENHGDPIDLSAKEQGVDPTKGTVEYTHEDVGFGFPVGNEHRDPQNTNTIVQDNKTDDYIAYANRKNIEFEVGEELLYATNSDESLENTKLKTFLNSYLDHAVHSIHGEDSTFEEIVLNTNGQAKKQKILELVRDYDASVGDDETLLDKKLSNIESDIGLNQFDMNTQRGFQNAKDIANAVSIVLRNNASDLSEKSYVKLHSVLQDLNNKIDTVDPSNKLKFQGDMSFFGSQQHFDNPHTARNIFRSRNVDTAKIEVPKGIFDLGKDGLLGVEANKELSKLETAIVFSNEKANIDDEIRSVLNNSTLSDDEKAKAQNSWNDSLKSSSSMFRFNQDFGGDKTQLNNVLDKYKKYLKIENGVVSGNLEAINKLDDGPLKNTLNKVFK